MRIVKTVDSLKLEYKKLLYMCNTRPVFKPRALFSDATENYRIPPECEAWDTVRIRLRVGRFNIERAYLYVDNEEYAMVRVDSDVSFDYYEAAIEVSDCVMSYYFNNEAASRAGAGGPFWAFSR